MGFRLIINYPFSQAMAIGGLTATGTDVNVRKFLAAFFWGLVRSFFALFAGFFALIFKRIKQLGSNLHWQVMQKRALLNWNYLFLPFLSLRRLWVLIDGGIGNGGRRARIRVRIWIHRLLLYGIQISPAIIFRIYDGWELRGSINESGVWWEN